MRIVRCATPDGVRVGYLDWGEQTGHADPQEFFDAAHRGRRWRASPTVLLGQLVVNRSPQATDYAEAMADVARAAETLGTPTPRTTGNAAVAAAAQLGALNRPAGPATTQPEVVAMLQALNQSMLDLSSLDLPGGFPGIDPATRTEPAGPLAEHTLSLIHI